MANKPKGAETDKERVDIAYALLTQFWPNWRIRDMLQLEYGFERRTADSVISRARSRISEACSTTKEEKREQVTTILEELIGDPKIDVRAKARLAKEYIELHGLRDTTPYEAPKKDVKVIVGNWRETFRKRLAKGKIISAAGNGGAKPKGGDGAEKN